MKALRTLVGSISLGVLSVAACGSGDSTKVSDAGAADASSADAGGDADSGKTADPDAGSACGQEVCATSGACTGIPYDHCGPINGTCSCAITCLETDAGTNCTGGAPCKTSPEGTKYCSATAAN